MDRGLQILDEVEWAGRALVRQHAAHVEDAEGAEMGGL